MAILKHVRRLIYIDSLIKRKATGNLENFAAKNGVCKRAMTDILNEMKELGFPIKYSRTRSTYYYHEHGEMVKNLFIREGQIFSKEEAAVVGRQDNLCFSELTIFELCK